MPIRSAIIAAAIALVATSALRLSPTSPATQAPALASGSTRHRTESAPATVQGRHELQRSLSLLLMVLSPHVGRP